MDMRTDNAFISATCADVGGDRVGTQIDWLCADFEASLHAPDAAHSGLARVLPGPRMSPSVTLSIGITLGRPPSQRRLDWSA
jgi:hypothetical protein